MNNPYPTFSDSDYTGNDLHDLCSALYPMCRSITGDGVRSTLEHLCTLVPLEICEVASGTKVFDWTVPKEWNLRAAYIETLSGEKLIDTANHNLHIVSYSAPFSGVLERSELEPHLHSLPDHADRIPYRTGYYDDDWGFCLSQNQRDALPDEPLRVVVDTSLEEGSLTYGEFFVPGLTDQEMLISTHICHPSLANDNLSGIAVTTYLAKIAASMPRQTMGLRFVFVPSTVGSITWLATNTNKLERIQGGVVISGVGDDGPLTYKHSRKPGFTDSSFAQATLLAKGSQRPFLPYGYDERQYCSPGVDLPIGCLMRTPYGEYDQYHTSADNLEFIKPASLAGALDTCLIGLNIAQSKERYLNTSPHGEPQLGRRGLYDQIGGNNQTKEQQLALLWLLSYSDGNHSLEMIREMSSLDIETLRVATQRLTEAGLLRSALQL